MPVLAGKALNVDERRGLHAPADILRHLRQAARQVDGGLGDHVHRSGLQRLHGDAFASLGERADYDGRGRHDRHEPLEEGHAVHLRHFHVERDDIRLQLDEQVACPVRVACLAHDLDLGVFGEARGENFPDERGIVDNQNPDFARYAHSGLRYTAFVTGCHRVPRSRTTSVKLVSSQPPGSVTSYSCSRIWN